MMRWFLRYLDKLLLVVGVGVFLASAVMAAMRFQRLDEIAERNTGAQIEPAVYEAEIAQRPVIETVSWPDAAPQSRGRDWVYDVFTPPVIYYNQETGEFTVTPPAFSGPVEDDKSPFDVELIAVRQEEYRIQLVGYIGNEGTPLGTFELVDTGGTVVGRAGRAFDREQFTIKSFEVRTLTTNSRESMPLIENVGVALIQDDRSGREETLTTRERKMLPRLQAVLRVRSNPPETRVVREGASIVVNGFSYLVTQLSLSPPQAVISRRAPDSIGASQTRTLVPAGTGRPAADASESRSSSNFSFSSR